MLKMWHLYGCAIAILYRGVRTRVCGCVLACLRWRMSNVPAPTCSFLRHLAAFAPPPSTTAAAATVAAVTAPVSPATAAAATEPCCYCRTTATPPDPTPGARLLCEERAGAGHQAGHHPPGLVRAAGAAVGRHHTTPLVRCARIH